MAGIGLRYLELARRLPALAGVAVRLVSPAAEDEARQALALLGAVRSRRCPPDVEVRTFRRGALAELLAGCDGVVAQGQLANDVVLELPRLPAAIDLYDPWLVENLHYQGVLGLDPYRNDHASWVLQMSRGDFFLCSSEEQRTFYLGFLAALGRLNPERVAADPDLAGLIAAVPFGLPRELPPYRPWLPPREAGPPGGDGPRRLLFGGLYDWYDPWTLLDALPLLPADLDWRLYLIANPNPGSTPQRLLGEVEAECRRRGWWGERVELLDWVPAARRYDLLRDVDLLVAPHRPSLETRLSLRTRFLDAAAAGCPAVTTAGGAMSRLLERYGAGWTVPAGEPAALAAALGRGAGRRRGGAGAPPRRRADGRRLRLGGGAAAARRLVPRAAPSTRPRSASPSGPTPWRRRTASPSARAGACAACSARGARARHERRPVEGLGGGRVVERPAAPRGAAAGAGGAARPGRGVGGAGARQRLLGRHRGVARPRAPLGALRRERHQPRLLRRQQPPGRGRRRATPWRCSTTTRGRGPTGWRRWSTR